MSDIIKKEWTVLRHGASGAGPGLNWSDTRHEAEEAVRAMAFRNPGIRYVLLEIIGTTLYPVPEIEVINVEAVG